MGKEFDYQRIDTMLDNLALPDTKYRYMMKAKYDPNGPGGYWADKRFRMAFSNIQWMMGPEDMKLEAPQLYNKKPIKVVTVLLENYSDQSDTGVANLKYDSTVSWSKADKVAVSGKVTLTNKYNAGLPLIGGVESSVAVEIAPAPTGPPPMAPAAPPRKPPNIGRYCRLKAKADHADAVRAEGQYSYASNMFMTYEAELYNFLRYSDNALNGHPSDRRFYLAKFGGKDGLTGAQDLLSQYLNPETSKWDWPWAVNQYSRSTIEYYIGAIAKRKFKQKFTGVFTAIDSTGYTINAGPVEPLPAQAAPGANVARSPAITSGIRYTVLSDMKDIAGSVKNLRFTLNKDQAKPSAVSPFK
ncbi:hypothetical protein BI344_16475 [Chromobacterium sphagni]|uniref:Aerolysin-like C-terminal domain-containing protein n=2 Tax=Chromobacterium sphagni TaxID=1903179 RepID=A0ABX3CCJ3_9NEIS|nr:hypothetical protein BI344_16475 [Chromobacterium sphagni]